MAEGTQDAVRTVASAVGEGLRRLGGDGLVRLSREGAVRAILPSVS